MAQAVTTQPFGGEKTDYQWMSAPQVLTGVPPGLEYLNLLDRVNVHQQLDLLEVVTGWERNNRYKICNVQDQQFFYAVEDTDCCMRQCCKQGREFTMNIQDNSQNVVMRLYRPLRCQGACCPCCLQEMEIQCPIGNIVATIKEVWTCTIPKYSVLDANGSELFVIEGPCCYCMPCQPIPFEVFSAGKAERIGDIVKHWGGCQEMLARVNDFSLTFPQNMNVIHKGILLGATFLIDFMYFERQD